VQAPALKAPTRGTVAGDFAGTAFAADELSRGSFNLGAPMQLPSERGTPHLGIVPAYSPESGISEWGLGWSNALALTRTRVSGSLDWRSDDWTGPWGRLVRGDDGFYYPLGLSAKVRVAVADDGAIAYLPDGTRIGFQQRVAGAGGTFAWYASWADDVVGARTRFTWQVNASGRPFLTRVEYGGRGDAFQARVELTYEQVETPFRDFRSGRELVLDRRVRSLSAQVLHAQTGAWVERWRYQLAFQHDDWGRAFYLAAIDQVFASSEHAPLRRFGYVDDDGRPDLEHSFDQALFLRKDAGFVRVDEPRRPDAYPGCRPDPWTYNTPRLLARLTPEASAPQVLTVESSWYTSDLIVCDRDGSAHSIQTVEGDFTPGENVHLTDLDRDHRPDLVRVFAGGYEILPNQSVGQDYRFGAARHGVLEAPQIIPAATWLQDMNGDGLPDLVSRTDATIVVWHGLGDLAFEPRAHEQELVSEVGVGESRLDEWQFRFVDANHDGLTDVLLTRQAIFRLFANTGTAFVETPICYRRSNGGIPSPTSTVTRVSTQSSPSSSPSCRAVTRCWRPRPTRIWCATTGWSRAIFSPSRWTAAAITSSSTAAPPTEKYTSTVTTPRARR